MGQGTLVSEGAAMMRIGTKCSLIPELIRPTLCRTYAQLLESIQVGI